MALRLRGLLLLLAAVPSGFSHPFIPLPGAITVSPKSQAPRTSVAAATSTSVPAATSTSVPAATSTPVPEPLIIDDLQWAGLGDSYASGVTYPHDPNLDWTAPRDPNCRRILDAYAVQMHNQTDWSGGRKNTFNFPACSGSEFADIEGQANFMSEVDHPAEFATLTIGGNELEFFKIAEACFYHPGPNYGRPYPDKGGECASRLAVANETLDLPSFQNDLENLVLNKLMARGQQDFPNFQIFLTGYPHFFNVDENSNWCNDVDFTVDHGFFGQVQKLTLDLRIAINDLIDGINKKHKEVVDRMKNPKIHFIDIAHALEGHLFCEKPRGEKPDNNDNYANGDSDGPTWLWNYAGYWKSDDTDNTTIPINPNDPGGPPGASPPQPSSPQVVRILHPTRLGHEAIMKVVKAAIKPTLNGPKDICPGINPSTHECVLPAGILGPGGASIVAGGK